MVILFSASLLFCLFIILFVCSLTIISQHKDETTRRPDKGLCFGKFGLIVGNGGCDFFLLMNLKVVLR
jgi:hypothetical protein